MADNVTNELILEHLKRLQDGQGRIIERLNRAEGRLSAIEAHLATLLLTSVSRIDSDIDSLTHRVDRIERRLEISDVSNKACQRLLSGTTRAVSRHHAILLT